MSTQNEEQRSTTGEMTGKIQSELKKKTFSETTPSNSTEESAATVNLIPIENQSNIQLESSTIEAITSTNFIELTSSETMHTETSTLYQINTNTAGLLSIYYYIYSKF